MKHSRRHEGEKILLLAMWGVMAASSLDLHGLFVQFLLE